MKRIALYASKQNIEQTAGVISKSESLFQPNYNIGHGQSVPVVYTENGTRHISSMRWGIQPEGAPVYETTYDEARNSTKLFSALELRRCLIPASGFYIWKTRIEDPHPFFARIIDRDVLMLAGIWASYKSDNEHTINGFALLEMPSNDLLKPVSPVMPVIIEPEDFEIWLNGQHARLAQKVTKSVFRSDMMVFRVPPLVNDPAENSRELIQPIPKLREDDEDE